jgi:DNA-binding NtrC family response regulator
VCLPRIFANVPAFSEKRLRFNGPYLEVEPKMKPKRILVVDDEHCITDTLVAILRLSGYDAVGSYCAECAIKDCENFNPELVITDVSMPGMNGVDLAMLLKGQHPGCRFLLISGQTSTVDLLEKARN